MKTKGYWVIKYANGWYFCGNNQFDKQLRKAQIYSWKENAEKQAEHMVKKPYGWVLESFADTYDIISVDIRESRDNHALWMWQPDDEVYICLNCHCTALNDYKGQSVDSPYCPHCGKRMTNSSMTPDE